MVVVGARLMMRYGVLAAVVGLGVAQTKDFDCRMKELGWAYAKLKQPWQGGFRSVFDALELGTKCGLKPPPDDDVDTAAPRRVYSIRTPPDRTFFVHPIDGNDGGSGTLEHPFRTLHAALAATRERAHLGARTIALRGGNHYLEQTLELFPVDSDLTIQAYNGEVAVVSGGKPITTPWVEHDVKHPQNIWVTDLTGHDFGNITGLQISEEKTNKTLRVTRARYPNSNPETDLPTEKRLAADTASWVPPIKYPTPKQVFLNSPVRNSSYNYQTYRGGIGGACSVYDPPFSYWCSEHTQGGGARIFQVPSGLSLKKASTLPNAPYKNPEGAIINTWRPFHWANWMFEVGNYTENTLTYHFSRGGYQGARGDTHGDTWFIENVFEELDAPNEFFYDRAESKLYLNYNGTEKPPASPAVVATQLEVLVSYKGDRWKPIRNMALRGMTFTASATTYMSPHGVPGGGDWALERMAAVFVEGTEDLVVEGCLFTKLDGNALMLSGYTRNATILQNEFSWLGGSAMASWGYTNETGEHPEQGMDGTDGNHPEGNQIISNLAHELGLYEKQSSFYIQAKTTTSVMKGNVFFNGPRAGINYNDGFGGGDEMTENFVFNTCRESSDHGPFNSWDRQPFITTTATGKPSIFMAWREIHHNFLLGNYDSTMAVDNDDGSAYYHTHHNFLVYAHSGMKSDYGGHDNWHHNNIYAYVDKGFGLTCSQFAGHGDYYFNNTVIMTGHDCPEYPNYGTATCSGPAVVVTHDNAVYSKEGNAKTHCGVLLPTPKDPGSSTHPFPKDEDVVAWAKALIMS